jgi:hypothetical protein
MSSISLAGDTSGTISLAVPAVAGTNTATLPAATGQIMVSGNQPAFSAYANSSTTLSAATFTKIAFQLKEYDTANCYDSTTNYRFTPNVAGYYQVIGSWEGNSSTTSYSYTAIYKNGSAWKRLGTSATLTGSTAAQCSCQLYLNGTTDYIEIYGINGSGTGTSNSQNQTYFQAILIRTA